MGMAKRNMVEPLAARSSRDRMSDLSAWAIGAHALHACLQALHVGRATRAASTPLPAPRFQRYLPDGREYYFWIDRSLPDIERRDGHYHIHRQTITVRVQWRRNTENDDLPRVLPAPGPTEPRPDDLLTPDFERTGQPGWADERTYPADGGGTVRIRSQRHCRRHPP